MKDSTEFHPELYLRAHCGVGAVADQAGHAKHQILGDALQSLERLDHPDIGAELRGMRPLVESGISGTELLHAALELLMAGGNCNTGHSLLVWAIGEGRDLARAIDQHLTGASRLPPSLRTAHPPLGPSGWGVAG